MAGLSVPGVVHHRGNSLQRKITTSSLIQPPSRSCNYLLYQPFLSASLLWSSSQEQLSVKSLFELDLEILSQVEERLVSLVLCRALCQGETLHPCNLSVVTEFSNSVSLGINDMK